VTGPDGTDSQANSAGSIPVTRSNVNAQVGSNLRTLGRQLLFEVKYGAERDVDLHEFTRG
jgi:hypothetical protein